ncbi:MAG TPA: 8-oxo-dGTP diphosphatase [Ignavibacteriales bacterium]|jgi:8-oxo-dGTP diphosphatase|nr:8-oxo-dGTP diphosphatase [Ignavibacteriales bacterium]
MKLATLCYVNNGTHTLMLNRIKRKDDLHYGKWNGLGGKFEPGETPEECVVREVYEESGLKIKYPKLRGVITFPSFDFEEDWYVFVFTAKHYEGELKKECNEGVLKWVPNSVLDKLELWDGDKIFMEWLNGDKFFSAKFIYENGKFKTYSVLFY